MTTHTLTLQVGDKVNLLGLTQDTAGATMQDSLANVSVDDATLAVQGRYNSDHLLHQGGAVTISYETGAVEWREVTGGEVTIHFDRVDLNRRSAAVE